jgi:hypothetical protein
MIINRIQAVLDKYFFYIGQNIFNRLHIVLVGLYFVFYKKPVENTHAVLIYIQSVRLIQSTNIVHFPVQQG